MNTPRQPKVVLHLQCKQDGSVRAMLNQMIEGQKIPAKILESGVITNENAARVYAAIFRKYAVDVIAARVWSDGLFGQRGWLHVWRDEESHVD